MAKVIWKLTENCLKNFEWSYEFNNTECISLKITHWELWSNLIIIKLWKFSKNGTWKRKSLNISLFKNKKEILQYFKKQLINNI